MSEQTVTEGHADGPAEAVVYEDAPPGPWDGLRVAAPALLLGLAALGFLFWGEVTSAVRVWEGSTAYSHCYFVLPIALYLAWDRRESLIGLMPQPLPWIALLALPMGVAWFGAERLGITEGRQLVAMTLVEALFLAVLGWRFFWALSAPLLYLYFLVPFGAFLTPMLQKLTAFFIPIGLELAGVPYYMDAFLIEIPEGSFYVAEACAGLRFLIASVAFGVLYSCLIYRTLWKRALFMLASIIIPIIANGIRAFGIVWLGHILGSAEAAAADHILYGWMFFSVVIILLILAGMPFREDEAPLPAPEPDPRPMDEGFGPALRPLRAALLLAVLAAAGPAGAMLLERQVTPPAVAAVPSFATIPGCTPPDARPSPAATMQQVFTCGPIALTVTVHVFPPRVNPNRIAAVSRTLTGEDSASDTASDTIRLPDHTPDRWRLTITEDPGWVSATAFWLDRQPRGGGLSDRAVQARRSILGADSAPVVVGISYHSGQEIVPMRERALAEQLIRAFVAAQTDLDPQIVALATAAAK
jgi:exosortase A